MQTRGMTASGVVPVPNRVLVCGLCGGRLGADKKAVVSANGFIYRQRVCTRCGEKIRTKQGPEEMCMTPAAGQHTA